MPSRWSAPSRRRIRSSAIRANPDAFDVRITSREDFPFFDEFEGRKFLRAGGWRTWKNDDLQSFTPVRFMPPELMNYQGRAVVIDPGCLRGRRRQRALDARHGRQGGHGARRARAIMAATIISPRASCCSIAPGSPHWNVRKQFEDMFAGKLDYEDWIILANEPRDEYRLPRTGMERFRPAVADDQAHPQYQAAHAAVEDRPADRLHQSHSAWCRASCPRTASSCGASTSRIPIRARRPSSSRSSRNASPTACSPKRSCKKEMAAEPCPP